MAEEVETRADIDSEVKFWRTQIDLASKREHEWRQRGRKVVQRYRDENRTGGRKFNILWSNVETLKPAVYSRTPKPDVRRRYLDKDPAGRISAEVLERGLSFSLDDYDFDSVAEAARDDMLLVGRGVARIRYDAEFVERQPQAIADGLGQVSFLLDGQPVIPDFERDGAPMVKEKTDERVWAEWVYWEDYREGPARHWEKVPWVGYRHFMTRDALREMFDDADDVPMTASLDNRLQDGRDSTPPEDVLKRATVWEVWDKEKKKVVWLAEGHPKLLEKEDPPFQLDGFFPQPEPIYAIKTTDTRVPIPEFTIYQDQADELDKITARIDALVETLKATGLYDSAVKEIRDLAKAADGEMIGIETASALRDKGGLGGSIFMWPITDIATVLAALIDHRDKLKAEIFEITGISDIIRGNTEPQETFGAQRLKANFGAIRLTPRQRPMQFFARDILRLKAEIIAELFDVETLEKMTGTQIAPPVFALLRDERIRGYRVDIETDSTIQPDAQLERQEATEFLGAITGYLKQAAEIGAQVPQATPLLMEMLKFGVRTFNTGRTFEETIERTAEEIQQAASQPRPNPEAQKAEQEAQLKAQQAQADARIKAQEMETNTQLKAAEMRADAALKARQQDIDAALRRRETSLEQ